MDSGEFVHRVRISGAISLRSEFALARIDDEPGNIQPASHHFRQIDLSIQILSVVIFRREILGIDVRVGIKRDHAFMNSTGDFFKICLIARTGIAAGSEESENDCHW